MSASDTAMVAAGIEREIVRQKIGSARAPPHARVR